MPTVTELRIEAYIIRALTATNHVLQYNPETDELCVWRWPMKDNKRVPPRGLHDYRVTNEMPNPICFCSLKFRRVNQHLFVEAAIYLVTTGLYNGQYVASCANDTCGYFVLLEPLYIANGPSKVYPPRGVNERVPPRVTHISENIPRPRRFLKRTFAMLDVTQDVDNNPVRSPAHQAAMDASPKTTDDLLAKLDAGGITVDEGQWLIVKCQCGKLLTRRSFQDHECELKVIDLMEE